jgi:hypothetical protein
MPEDETQKPAKIRLLSADAIKAIYEREMAKKGLPADCDEAKLEAIVKNLEMKMPPGVEIEYVSGDEIRNEDKKPLGNKVDISPSEQKTIAKKLGDAYITIQETQEMIRGRAKEPPFHFRQLGRLLEMAFSALEGALEELEKLEVERLSQGNQSS